ncbi:MAG: thiamine-phosphate kinase [Planctomyces sp.]|jgi:thiamine-monophosphate kinase
MDSELQFIRDLTKQLKVRPPVEVGIGDDGAVLRLQSSDRQVVVTDMLLDGIHFDLKTTSPELAGRKAVAVNLSDLAAMGCRPTAAFVSIAVPFSISGGQTEFLRRLYDGIRTISEEFSFTIAGGDTNSWNGPFAINVCLTGEPFAEREALRSEARPGDFIFVTGRLGGSLRNQRHLTFRPHLVESEWLMKSGHVHAMMDISDGLAIDLHRLLEASHVGAIIDAAAIPIHDDVDPIAAPEQRLQSALSDGEDFVLLVTASPDSLIDQTKAAEENQFFLRKIGEITSGRECLIRDSQHRTAPLPVTGWQHQIRD